jgi:hypothetical protein
MALVGGRKVSGKQEDVHQLRLMDNRHLQYRFLNARADVAAKAKTSVTVVRFISASLFFTLVWINILTMCFIGTEDIPLRAL